LECSRAHVENLIWDGNAEGNRYDLEIIIYVVLSFVDKLIFFLSNNRNSVVDIFETTTYGKKTIAADVDADGQVQ
jgi:hypothetical protein